MLQAAELSSLSEDQLRAQAWHTIPVAKLCRLSNPLGCWSELDRPITRTEVRQCIKEGRAELVETPLWTAYIGKPAHLLPTPAQMRDNHVRKIAYFVIHGVRDPIDLDVGVPEYGCTPSHLVEDGNHRLAGAWIRRDPTIRAQVGGSIQHAQNLGLWQPNAAEQELQRRYDQQLKQEAARPRRTIPA